jgi:hypothetical protein
MRLRGAPRIQGLTALAVVASLAALTAGCGSSSNQAATTAAPTAPGAASPTQPAPTASAQAPATTAAPTTTAGGGSTTTTSTSQTGGTPAGSGGGGGSRGQSCPSVSFVQATSHGAFQISTTGASCGTAQTVAGAARSCFGCSYSAQGFHCTGREVTTGLIRVNYTCTQGSDRITFVRG